MSAMTKWGSRPSTLVRKNKKQIYILKNPNVIVPFDGTPCPRGIAWMLQDCRQHGGWSGSLLSCDRRKGIPEIFGRKSQYALYMGWIQHLAGYLPANPPGRSTHEYVNDGVAYPVPAMTKLAWWMVGMDVTEWDELLRAMKKLGYHGKQPYSSGSEAHHINMTISPWEVVRHRFNAGKLKYGVAR